MKKPPQKVARPSRKSAKSVLIQIHGRQELALENLDSVINALISKQCSPDIVNLVATTKGLISRNIEISLKAIK